MQKICNFYENHKKQIWIGAVVVGAYWMGYNKGFNSFKKILIESCKVIQKEMTQF